MASIKTLTVFCMAGLANRLRVLVSGLAAAEITGRKFNMYWPRTSACFAAFNELFTNDWPVIDIDSQQELLNYHRTTAFTPLGTIERLISDPRDNIVLGTTDWIVNNDPQQSPEMYSLCCKLLGELEPLPEIIKRISEIKQHFYATMIGVHL